MTSEETAFSVIDALEKTGVAYMIVGSLATNFYGIARSTRDADILVEVNESTLQAIRDSLPGNLILDPQLTFETATFACKSVIKDRQSPFEVELFHLSDDEHNRRQFERRQRVRYAQTETWIPSAEDVIIAKLRWGLQLNRRKDEDDVRDVIAVQKANLDWSYVESWCDKHGTRQLPEHHVANRGYRKSQRLVNAMHITASEFINDDQPAIKTRGQSKGGNQKGDTVCARRLGKGKAM